MTCYRFLYPGYITTKEIFFSTNICFIIFHVFEAQKENDEETPRNPKPNYSWLDILAHKVIITIFASDLVIF